MYNSEAPSNSWLSISYSREEFPAKVVSEFLIPVAAERYRQLGGDGGLSGAKVWQVMGEGQEYCLRQWPKPHPSVSKLTEIHRCMFFARSKGLETVPAIIRPRMGRPIAMEPRFGESFIEAEGLFWELSYWLQGKADYWLEPSEERLKSACRALGQLHAAWRDLAPHGDANAIGMQLAPAIMDRIWRLQALTPTAIEELGAALQKFVNETWARDGATILQQIAPLKPTFLADLTYWSKYTFPCQYVMRDIWHDHVLFQGTKCSGLIDYGAVRIDTVATDLVRMLGSLTKSAPNMDWQTGLIEYQRENRLNENELGILEVLYRSSVLLSGVQWIRWLAVDELQFPGKETFVKQRLAELATGAQAIAASQRSVMS
jgi:homoserine kinase type II